MVCTCGGGCGMSAIYKLKRVGERTPPWGTPVLVLRSVDLMLL